MRTNNLLWGFSLGFCLFITCLSNGQQIKKDSTEASSAGNVIIMKEPPIDPGGGGNTYPWNRDRDRDGYGDPNFQIERSSKPTGYVSNNLDCDDTNPNIGPGTYYYSDADNDGFGDPNSRRLACSRPSGYVSNSKDNCPNTYGLSNGCPDFSDENYVYTRSYRQPYSSSLSHSQVTPAKATESITYFDGLGRPMQQIGIKQSGGTKDIITPIGYDEYGRQDKEYLPYVEGNGKAGSYRSSGVLVDLENYYHSRYGEDFNGMTNNTSQVDGLPVYSEKHLESSPLSRVLEQGAPGKSWQVNKTSDNDHTIKFDYQINTGSEVRLYKVTLSSSYEPSLLLSGHYDSGELYKTVVKDENWTSGKLHTTEEFKDKQGRVVLKRTYGPADKNMDGNIGSGESVVAHDTYYVYDDYGNLTYVLPPKAAVLSLNDLLAGASSGGSTTGGDAVYSQAVVGNGESLHLTSSDVIVLQPGFHAKSGSNFSASIDGTSTGGSQNSLLDELCYQYRYDERNRLIEKKIPGKGREYIVYNKLDQPILTQDALQKSKSTKEWLFTKYDAFGRVVYTGLYKSNLSRSQHQDYADGENDQYEKPQESALSYGGGTFYYTDNAYPDLSSHSSSVTLYTVNYYDDYRFYGSNLPQSVYNTSVQNYNNASSTRINTKGLATGSRVRVLTTNSWITTVMGYDKKGRMIYSKTENPYLQSSDVLKSKLDFIGQMEESTTVHTKSGQPSITTVDKFEYDDLGRLTKQTQKINSQAEELIAFNEYDELGQLKKKKVGNTTTSPLQTVDYTYNVRGWLKRINDPNSLGDKLFAFKLNYNTTEMGIDGVDALFNGNISETIWRTANTETYGNRKRGYAYQYDAMNRIKSGAFRRAASNGSSFTEQASNYNLTGMVYDLNGNIRKLKRYGPTLFNSQGGVANYGLMDNLTYSYDAGNSSNKLMQVSDAGNKDYGFKDGATSRAEFGYDVNGNLTSDANKGITSITYNHLNLPVDVEFNNSSSQVIKYTYDAMGMKLRKEVPGKTTDYAGNFVYEKIGAGANELQFFSTSEGYVSYDNGQLNYVYNYVDHLGNVRLSYTDANQNNGNPVDLQIVQEKNYYPFGLTHQGYNGGDSSLGNDAAKRYGFGGKELQDEIFSGDVLDWYDFGARNYNPDLGRWMNMDPLAEVYYERSPYNYTLNNPILFLDPDGKRVDTSFIYAEDEEGNYKNPNLVKAFEIFAKSKEGIDFLSKYAESNQVIAGHKYKSDGEFHGKGIDLGFNDLNNENPNEDGTTSSNISDNKLAITINLDNRLNVDSYIETIGHEGFIHANKYAEDYSDNKIMDFSKGIDRSMLPAAEFAVRAYKDRPTTAQTLKERYLQHWQSRPERDNTMTVKVLPILLNYYRNKGVKVSKEEIKKEINGYEN
ncbi:DUF6443 domain-containing protein [Zunongwangia sp.]|uniref:DUF6443 domain-containing protein n=1 Tax=Zunongwangia sp. TaxID=1965325 RepID=UPI003AA92F19